MIVEIVILAMIAAFLGLRLYSVLGRRPEQGEEPLQSRPADAALPRAARPLAPDAATGAVRGRPRGDQPATLVPPGPAEQGIRAIIAADRRFDAGAFLEGARNAYGMILEAFWRGDKEALAQLCDRDVYDSFAAAIDARAAAGETVDNRLIRIEEAVIEAAEYNPPVARIRVRFTADIAAVTRDAQGTIIAGTLDDAIESRDAWTFSRNLNATDPDWLLEETDDA